MMTHDEMLIRMGFYCGHAERDLGDSSYVKRWRGHAEDITEAEYERTAAEIHARLLAAGKIRPDEDPYDAFLRGQL